MVTARQRLVSKVRSLPLVWDFKSWFTRKKTHKNLSHIQQLHGFSTPFLGNHYIRDAVIQRSNFAFGKIGATEMKVLISILRGGVSRVPKVYREELFFKSGVFPVTDNGLRDFFEVYVNAIESLDILFVWGIDGEREIIERYNLKCKLIHWNAAKFWNFEKPWVQGLSGKSVLNVSPFIESFREQAPYLVNIWPTIIDNKAWHSSYVKMPFSPALVSSNDKCWVDRINRVTNLSMKHNFDVAVVSAGAASLPICHMLRDAGSTSIHLGGIGQLLYGVYGNRFEKDPSLFPFLNEYWRRPSSAETPELARFNENGAYW